MQIIASKNFKKDYKKKIIDKHLVKEIERINNIESLIINASNLEEVFLSPYKKIYSIEQKRVH